MESLVKLKDFDIYHRIDPKIAGSTRENQLYMVVALKSIGTIVKDSMYAMKVLFNDKKIRNEVHFGLRVNHPNVIKCHAMFKEENKTYIIMDYCKDGDLFSKGRIRESEIKKVLTDILGALAYCHSIGITHRDVKTENILIDGNTYKLCDWDGAIYLKPNQTTNACYGTLSNFAPELVDKQFYKTGDLDMWCIGCLAVELLGGYRPFESSDRASTFQKIRDIRYTLPYIASKLYRDFIGKLLVKTNRMTAVQALEHSFLKTEIPIEYPK